MATLKYCVRLGEEERSLLRKRISSGHDGARVLMRARVLLKADEGTGETEIAQALEIHPRTVEKVRQRYCEGGLERALHEKPRPGAQRKLDGKQEAHLIAVACSDPPDGRQHWTLKLLADEVVKLEFTDTISPETVRQILKKTNSSHGKKRSGAFRR